MCGWCWRKVEDTGCLAEVSRWTLRVVVSREGGQDVLNLCDGLTHRGCQGRGREELGLKQRQGHGSVGLMMGCRNSIGGECLLLGRLRLGGRADELYGRLGR